MKQTFGQSVKQGFGFGLGSSIARSLFGGGDSSNRDYHTSNQQPSVPAEVLRENREWREYQRCLQESIGDFKEDGCKHLLPAAAAAVSSKQEMK